jgi:cyanophycinase-like exopeptidase
VLCSDGLHGSVADEDLLRFLREFTDAKEAAHRLVDEAYRNGSSDNISAAVVVFGGGPQSTGAAQPLEVEKRIGAAVRRGMRVAAQSAYVAILPEYAGTRGVSRSVWQRLLGRRRVDATNLATFTFFVVVTTIVLLLVRSLM